MLVAAVRLDMGAWEGVLAMHVFEKYPPWGSTHDQKVKGRAVCRDMWSLGAVLHYAFFGKY